MMSCRYACVLPLAGLIVLGLVWPRSAEAGGPFQFFSRLPAAWALDHQQGDLGAIALGTSNQHQNPGNDWSTFPGYSPGPTGPSYNWGYFGANYRTTAGSHNGYHGHSTRWIFRTGY